MLVSERRNINNVNGYDNRNDFDNHAKKKTHISNWLRFEHQQEKKNTVTKRKNNKNTRTTENRTKFKVQ